MDASAARRHLEALATSPRPAGSAEERRAREYCAGVLRASGFHVAEEPFEYSALPGLLATPALGVAAAVVILAVGHLGYHGSPGAGLAALVAAIVVGGAVASWVTRKGVLTLGMMRARSTNLVAMRSVPSLWLVAHLDSKSQPVPILVRAVGVMALLAVIIVAVAVLMAQLAGMDVRALWPWISGAGVVSALPVAASFVSSRSPGALDDASGVATVLMVAQSIPQQLALGIVLTSAEELGLAGARAWLETRGPAHAINLDGIDDAGDLRITWTGTCPRQLVERVRTHASAGSLHVRTARLLPGVLLDGVAFADAGWTVVTLSRGTIRTVARIHTRRDTIEQLTGDGIARVAEVLRSIVTSGA